MFPQYKYISLLKQKPLLLIRGARFFSLSTILGKRILRGVDFAVTYKCQAKCAKCSCRDLIDTNRAELSKGQILEISGQAIEAGALFINFTGGEPLLREDIYEIIPKLSKMPALISLSTNALLLSTSLIRKLKESGLNVMQVNLSSPFVKEHDREIGWDGSYARTMECVRAARRLGIEVLINLVVTKEILYSERIKKMAAVARQNKCFLSLVLPAQVGGWKNEQVNLRQEDHELVKKWLKLNFVVTDTESCYNKKLCPAGTEKIYISPYGDLYPCAFIHTNYGNILENKLSELWEKMNTTERRQCVNIAAVGCAKN